MFGGCDERPTEMSDVRSGYAEFRCEKHAEHKRWKRRWRVRLSDMQSLPPATS
jgi:hypothetical protein